MANILDTAADSSDFNILVNAVNLVDSTLSAGIATQLASSTFDITVFAPTDAAFTQLAVDLGFDGDTADEGAVTTFLATNLDAELIRDVLLYHVSPGEQLLASFSDGVAVHTLLSGATFTPDGPTLVDNEPDLIDPTLVETDIIADNGVIHAIDRVLLPADLEAFTSDSITDIVAASGSFDDNAADFDILLNAVIAADLADTLASDEVDLTVFAPTDAAFVGLATALGFTGTGEEEAFGFIVEALTLLGGGDPIPLLTNVLQYHVLPDSLQSAQVLGEETLTTLLGADLTVDGASLEDLEPDLPNANLISLDIQASNGIVHVIDGVLLPADLLGSDGNNDVDFIVGDNTDEVIRTGSDDDFITGGRGNDDIKGGTGNDTILGGRGADTLAGNRGDDTILGGGGKDIIKGGKGEDTINGGANRDELRGGADADTFIFEMGGGRDLILDFASEDKIDVSDFGIESFEELSELFIDQPERLNINFGDGDRVLLIGVEASEVTEDNFIYADPGMMV
ncbi:MAG: fasciclin domain-containing protein [Pseudomonadota bacterium]